MTSLLEVTDVNKLQDRINTVLELLDDIPGVYVALNKTQKSTKSILKKKGIKTKLFFIDCVSAKKTKEDKIFVSPDNLNLLAKTIKDKIDYINTDNFLMIDALSTLLIYNTEENVVKFVKKIAKYASQNYTSLIAFSPLTIGEELLAKTSDYFDEYWIFKMSNLFNEVNWIK